MKTLLLFFAITFFSHLPSYAIGGGATTVIEQELHIDTECEEVILHTTILGNMGNPVLEIVGNMQTQQVIGLSLLQPGSYVVVVQTSGDGIFSDMIYYYPESRE
ncbi:MAG: hypothetical protein IPK03_05445 [Bacteroidetes bacterium]|nr:hypothetical protein [Bacteroidota bacterium]